MKTLPCAGNSLGEAIIVTVIATGFDLPNTAHPTSSQAQTNILFDRPVSGMEDSPIREEVVSNFDDDEVPQFFKSRT